MGTYRRKAIVRVTLVALTALLAGFSPLGPEAAQAAPKAPRRFVFGPVTAPKFGGITFSFFNSGTLPTPPGVMEIRRADNGELFSGPFPVPSVVPGSGRGIAIQTLSDRVTVVGFLTFDRPMAGQSIPSPFPGTLQVLSGDTPNVAVGPAH
jgi:hypothetical protein